MQKMYVNMENLIIIATHFSLKLFDVIQQNLRRTINFIAFHENVIQIRTKD